MTSLPINIEQLIRSYGIELDKDADLPEGISGQIEMIDKDRHKISIQRKDHYYRKRFTMAHELGHFLLHKDKIGAGLDDTRLYRAMHKMGDGVSNREEMEANKYAAITLMPEDQVMFYVNNGLCLNEEIDREKLYEVAKVFQVSPMSLEIRIKGLRQNIENNYNRSKNVKN